MRHGLAGDGPGVEIHVVSTGLRIKPRLEQGLHCFAAMRSKHVGTTRRMITSTCPDDTGNEPKITKQRSFARNDSVSVTSENSEGAVAAIVVVPN